MDGIIICALMGCFCVIGYGIVEVRKDIEKLKKIIEENSKLLK